MFLMLNFIIFLLVFFNYLSKKYLSYGTFDTRNDAILLGKEIVITRNRRSSNGITIPIPEFSCNTRLEH